MLQLMLALSKKHHAAHDVNVSALRAVTSARLLINEHAACMYTVATATHYTAGG
jgi:hypothetical protein